MIAKVESKPCECDGPGFCKRHQRHKTMHTFRLCQTRADYRDLWDQLAAQPRLPSTFQQKLHNVKQYGAAIIRWIKAGRPVRSDESVQGIVRGICGKCRDFNPKGYCKLCGCRINEDANALRNKARMATENCPVDKW